MENVRNVKTKVITVVTEKIGTVRKLIRKY